MKGVRFDPIVFRIPEKKKNKIYFEAIMEVLLILLWGEGRDDGANFLNNKLSFPEN